jgi:hypothetical protein
VVVWTRRVFVWIKDAPHELPDGFIYPNMGHYDQVIQGSMTRGKIRNTNIENGTRYVQLLTVETPITSSVQWGWFWIRIFCDNHKTECSHCGKTDHPYFNFGKLRESTEDDNDKLTQEEMSASPVLERTTTDSVTENVDTQEIQQMDQEDNTVSMLVLGASLVNFTEINHPKVEVKSESGSSIKEVEKVIEQTEAQKRADKIRKVVIQLGTNDVSMNGNDEGQVMIDYSIGLSTT